MLDRVIPYAAKPEPPDGACDQIPDDEKIKFAKCSLAIILKRRSDKEAQKAQIQDAVKEQERSTWSWLNTPPNANCQKLPPTELKKFSCEDPDAVQRREYAAVLEDLLTTRKALAAQIRRLQNREARIANEQPDLATPELQAHLDKLAAIDRELGLRSMKRRLLEKLSSRSDLDRLQISASAFWFATPTSTAPIFSGPDSNAATIGRLNEGELVIAIDLADRQGVVALLRARDEAGFVERGTLEPTGHASGQ